MRRYTAQNDAFSVPRPVIQSLCCCNNANKVFTDQSSNHQRDKHCIFLNSSLLQKDWKQAGTLLASRSALYMRYKERAVSLSVMLARSCIWLLFDPGMAPGQTVRLGRAQVGAQGVEGVVIGATEAIFQRGGRQRSRFMFLTEGTRAEVTQR